MSEVVENEMSRTMKRTDIDSLLQTPPRTPTITAASSQTLASEIRNIYDALSELADLSPGEKVNTLLTRLVSVCIVPYSNEFVAYFFSIEGIHSLCERLRPVCATAEGELERFWANKIIEESRRTEGKGTGASQVLHRLECCGHGIANTAQQPQYKQSSYLPPFPTTKTILTFLGSSMLLSPPFYLTQPLCKRLHLLALVRCHSLHSACSISIPLLMYTTSTATSQLSQSVRTYVHD